MGSIVVLLILAILLVPVLFKGKLTNMAKNMINDNLNAVVDFKDVNISIFKNFPKVTLSLEELTVVSKNEQLASIASFGAGINLMPLIKNGTIDVQLIDIKSPKLHAKVFQDSTVNWDIVKPSEDVEEPETDTGDSEFNITVEKFTISDGSVMYEDLTSNTIAVLNDIDFNLKGDLSNKNTSLNLNASINDINLMVNSLMLVSEMGLTLKGDIGADLEQMIFTLNGTEIDINKMGLLADGTIGMKGDDMNIDVTYGAKVPSLKTLLDMVPSAIIPEVKNVDTKGNLALKGWVKGVYNDSIMPQIWCELNVDDGYIKYPELPKSVDNINIDAKVLFDANEDKNTKIDLNRFHFEIGGNPFDISANVQTPMTDADIKAAVKGKLDFASIKDALPLDGIDLKGILTANIDFAGRMSNIEREQYDRLNLAGNLNLQNFKAVTEDLPVPIDITNAGLEFTPRYVNLSDLDIKMGESDIKASGRLENFLNYAMKNETLKGNLSVSSNYINCNQLMSGEADTTAVAADTTALSVIVLPSNVDLTMNASINKILYDNLTLNNAKGSFTIKDRALNINNLSAGFAGGTINLSGKYMAENTLSALANMDMKVKDIHVKDLANSFSMFDKVLPILRELDGKVSLDFNFSDKLDQNMSPVIMALNAVGSFKADSLKLLNQETLNKITSLIGVKEQSNTLKKVNASFAVTDGKVGINPFPANIGNTNIMIGGDYGLDESLALQVDLKVPAAQLSGAVNNLLSQWGAGSNTITANTVNVGVAIGGNIKNPTFNLAKAKYMGDSPTIGEQATDQAKQLIEDKKQELQNQLQEKIKEETKNQTGDAVNKLKDLFKKDKN